MAKIATLVEELARPLVLARECTLWDVEYVKEAGGWVLRVTIDKEGGVGIEDCEAVSRPLSDKLDEVDPIEGAYTLEVASAGCERALKKPEHFAAFLGAEVDVRLYRPRQGRKEFTGVLAAYDNGTVTLQDGACFSPEELAQVRLHMTV